MLYSAHIPIRHPKRLNEENKFKTGLKFVKYDFFNNRQISVLKRSSIIVFWNVMWSTWFFFLILAGSYSGLSQYDLTWFMSKGTWGIKGDLHLEIEVKFNYLLCINDKGTFYKTKHKTSWEMSKTMSQNIK